MELGLMLTQGPHVAGMSQVLAYPTTTLLAAFELTAPRATLVAAIIAAVASLFGAIMTRNTANRQKLRDKNAKEIETCRKQLGDLYAPLAMLRLKSRRLYDVLRDEMHVAPVGEQDWRLVDHIVDVAQSKSSLAKSSAIKILEINSRIESLLEKNAGLLEATSPRHESFDKFITHNTLLQQAWELGVNENPTARETFPYEFDVDIENDTEIIWKRLNELLAA